MRIEPAKSERVMTNAGRTSRCGDDSRPPSDSSPRRVRRGFTLIELLVAISIISLLIGIVLPSAMSSRVTYNRSEAKGQLGNLGVAFFSYNDDFGFPPPKVSTTDPFWQDVVADRTFSFEFSETGETLISNGYEFEYTPLGGTLYAVTASPVVIGLTGETSLMLLSNAEDVPQDGDLTEETIEGAEEIREIVLSRIQQASLDLIAELALADGDPETSRQVLTFIDDPDAIEVAFVIADQDNDQQVTIGEIFTTLAAISPEFAEEIEEELMLGSGGERVDELPGVRLDDATGRPSDLISFDNVCDFLKSSTTSDGIANSLCRKLENAEAAERRGDFDSRDDMLEAFQDEIESQSGKKIGPADALKLIVLAEMLKAE